MRNIPQTRQETRIPETNKTIISLDLARNILRNPDKTCILKVSAFLSKPINLINPTINSDDRLNQEKREKLENIGVKNILCRFVIAGKEPKLEVIFESQITLIELIIEANIFESMDLTSEL